MYKIIDQNMLLSIPYFSNSSKEARKQSIGDYDVYMSGSQEDADDTEWVIEEHI